MTPAGRSFVVIVCAVLVATAAGVIGLGFIVNTNDKSYDIKDLSERVVRIGERIEDCSSREGKCYKENQKATGEAIQAILEGLQGQVTPHRLRNEAENLCQVELFGGTPPLATSVPVEQAVATYIDCVLRRSGGTEPPPLPTNPFTTTTTGKKSP